MKWLTDALANMYRQFWQSPDPSKPYGINYWIQPARSAPLPHRGDHLEDLGRLPGGGTSAQDGR